MIMYLIQFRHGKRVSWGRLLRRQKICLDFGRATRTQDICAFLNSGKKAPLAGLTKTCLEKKNLVPAVELELLPPLCPGTIFGVGCNFKATSRNQKEPIIFLKAVHSVTGPQKEIIIPSDLNEVVAEVELGVVLGKNNSIFGYTIVNDLTARGLENEDIWFYRKSLAGFAPLGPWIVRADKIKNAMRLDVSLCINGEVKIKSNTSQMIFSPREIIAALARRLPLQPGDLIMMGCPGLPDKLKTGDIVRADIEKIGFLENRVVKGS